ncbi:DUF2335 domain-containing protein [Streptococcus caviae]|uniref:DUF2335 domain-containing protein n=1 Tax=Streptococcus sp. 'caviae' TaxID=1915004 RepID=UPI00094BC568|nr:DUF2335 domain-containing protein [Streptococcus sp. 'caviae']OLN84568.1 hypothetical protein BMI76_00355 [Streptococcus sp. 'caviae']
MTTENKNSNEIENIDSIVEEVEKLPIDQRQVVLQKLEIYQGDLPHPDILEGYNRLYPDAAKKIIDNGISESVHRRKMEERYLSGNITAHKLGQLFGFLIATMVIIGGIYLIAKDKQIAGSILTGTTALGLIGLFTGNNNSK